MITHQNTNHIHHVLIDKILLSNTADVRSFREADYDTGGCES